MVVGKRDKSVSAKPALVNLASANKVAFSLLGVVTVTIIYWLAQPTPQDSVESLQPISSDTQNSGKTLSRNTAVPGKAIVGNSNTVGDNVKSSEKLDSVAGLIDGLRKRLEKTPEDVKGWVLLAQSYHHLQRWQEAGEAFEKARALGYSGEAPPLPNRTINSSPVFSGSSRPGTNNRLALPPETGLLSGYLEQSSAQPPVEVDALKASSGIKLNVKLAPALIDQLSPEKTVFIFARAAESGGPPLAVFKKMVSDLPFEAVLDDSMAMIPGRTISSVERVVVGVRVSLSGSPIRQNNDFEQLSKPIASDYDDIVTLVISDQIEDDKAG